VVAEGIHAQVSGASTAFEGAIGVDPGSTGAVSLRGLAVRGASTGASKGIRVDSGRVRVERCTVSNFGARPDGAPTRGISVFAGSVLTVVDTVLRDNLGAIETGSEGATRVSIERCFLHGDGSGNSNGIQVGRNTLMAIVDSLVTDHDVGAYIRGAEGSPRATLALTGTTVTNNRIGVYADRTGQALLTRCTVTLNDTGLFTLNGGLIYTAGDNAVFGNFTSNMGAGTAYLKPDLSA
jgi:Right handed beta helix region